MILWIFLKENVYYLFNSDTPKEQQIVAVPEYWPDMDIRMDSLQGTAIAFAPPVVWCLDLKNDKTVPELSSHGF